ncbi:hypothetical protein CEE45_13100 [Candidatus Heimdallarchaeota archaeon B3_Heim]|nr:MAG: hypothetical protein CEE45_13100 [Candidatus Heimdallarchaeota archaeon B3_Heim]
MATENQIHDLDISWQLELRFLGWRIWWFQNTIFVAMVISLIPIIIFSISGLWKFGYFLFSILKITFSIYLLLDLIAVALIGANIASSRNLRNINRLEKRFLAIIGLCFLLTLIIRLLLIGICFSSSLTDINILSQYVGLLTESWFLFIWVVSNALLFTILITDSHINHIDVRRGVLEEPRVVFGFFSFVPVFVLFFERLTHISSSLFYDQYSAPLYIGVALVMSKCLVAPALGRRAGKLEIKKIIESHLVPEIDKSRRSIIVNMKKTRYLKSTKRIRNVFVVIGIFSLLFPFSPLFLTKMYKEPEISVIISRPHANNEALSVLEYVEVLPLKNITGINSENIMTNSTLQERLNLIEDSKFVDIFYLFSSTPSYLSLFWEMSVEKLNDLLLDTSIVKSYWPEGRSGYYGYEEDFEDSYFVYWVDGTKNYNLDSFNSSEPFAEWLCKGIQSWSTNSGSLFGSNTLYVDQLLFLDVNLDPVCFVYREYSGGYYYI